jgi:hypothetical protein
MKRTAVMCLITAFFAGSVFSQTVDICGKVTDPAGNPLIHTVVRLGQATYDKGYGPMPYIVQTDNNGFYKMGFGNCTVNTITPRARMRGEASSRPVYVGGKILFCLPACNALVQMSLYDLSGRFVRDVMNKNLPMGNYSVSIDTRGISSQFYLLRVVINGATSVMRLQPASHLSGGAVVQSAPGFVTRLEKFAAFVDTLHATEPGYSIGVTPLPVDIANVLQGQYDFVLTKTTTWNGDVNAFWGDTSTYPKTGVTYVVLNRTNGAFPDSKIYWSNQQGGAKTAITTANTFKCPGSGRFYIWVAPTDSNNRYFDFIEQNLCGVNGWCGNTTRVDGFRLPITFRVHKTTGRDTIMGDAYEMFYQSRQAKIDEYLNEVPKEFTPMAKVNNANIYAPHMTATNYFNTGGPYVDYFSKYIDSVIVRQTALGVTNIPAKVNAWNIFACTGGGMGASPDYSAAVHRHVGTRPQGANFINWRVLDSTYYYQEPPCNYFSRWSHRRSINNFSYGFPYDDDGGHASFMDPSNVLWIAIAIGW